MTKCQLSGETIDNRPSYFKHCCAGAKRHVGIIGIGITIVGWIVSNADHFPFVYQILAPKYLSSISAFDKMHQKNFILREGDIGFPEISKLLKEHMTGKAIPIIIQVKTLDWGTGAVNTSEGMKWRNYIKLEVSFSNSQPATGEFYDLKLQIKKRYLTCRVFLWSSTIFWIGIAITLISLFL